MSVPVTTEGGFRTTGQPRALFSTDGFSTTVPARSYDVAPDGSFVIPGSMQVPDPTPASRINFVLNWFEELKRLAPGR
jgi:hypothetical protein